MVSKIGSIILIKYHHGGRTYRFFFLQGNKTIYQNHSTTNKTHSRFSTDTTYINWLIINWHVTNLVESSGVIYREYMRYGRIYIYYVCSMSVTGVCDAMQCLHNYPICIVKWTSGSISKWTPLFLRTYTSPVYSGFMDDGANSLVTIQLRYRSFHNSGLLPVCSDESQNERARERDK